MNIPPELARAIARAKQAAMAWTVLTRTPSGVMALQSLELEKDKEWPHLKELIMSNTPKSRELVRHILQMSEKYNSNQRPEIKQALKRTLYEHLACETREEPPPLEKA